MSETKVELHPTQQITVATDSREILANARKDTAKFGLDDYFIVDVDSHHVELDSWPEIIENIEDPVLRDVGRRHLADWPQGETAQADAPKDDVVDAEFSEVDDHKA